jgi:hypothetical protein
MDATALHGPGLGASVSGTAGPPPGPPSECTALLRAVADRVARSARDGDPRRGLDEGGREALDVACRAARERGLQAEHVVLALKELWRVLPEPRQLERHDAHAALAYLVTECVTAFYAPARARMRTPAPPRQGRD